MNQKETCNTTDKQADISFKTEKQYKRGEITGKSSTI